MTLDVIYLIIKYWYVELGLEVVGHIRGYIIYYAMLAVPECVDFEITDVARVNYNWNRCQRVGSLCIYTAV